jgi:hypothetical protein
MPYAPEMPLGPAQVEAVRQGLFTRPGSGKPWEMTPEGQQRFRGGEQGGGVEKKLGDIHEEIKGQRTDLEKVLTVS